MKHSRFLWKLVFLFLGSAFFFPACQKKVEQSIDFDIPGEEPLAYLPGVEWAVVTDSVAALREDAGFEHKVSQHARRGDIFVVTGKQLLNVKAADGTVRTVVWYGFDQGWLIEDSLSIYENRMNAQNAAEQLLKR